MANLQIGDKIFGNWIIQKVIGSGSFGTVYEIKREEFGHVYTAAAKVISLGNDGRSVYEDEMTDENITEYYQSLAKEIIEECNLMEQMKGDSYIVSYEDHLVERDEDGIGFNIYIRMELLTPLITRLRQHALSENEVIKLGIDICRALETCQQYKVIHRDIKPENIFVSNTKNYKLGDFGIAKTLDTTDLAMSKKGTQNYMAPEVYLGRPYDATVDMYSLGLVLFRMLNDNRSPFLPLYPQNITATDLDKALTRRMQGEPLPAPCKATEALTAVIQKACSYKPSMRYQSPKEMRRDLEALYEEEQTPAYKNPVRDWSESNIDNGEKGRTKSIFDKEAPGQQVSVEQKKEPEQQVPIEQEKEPEIQVSVKQEKKPELKETIEPEIELERPEYVIGPEMELHKKSEPPKMKEPKGKKRILIALVAVLCLCGVIGGIFAIYNAGYEKEYLCVERVNQSFDGGVVFGESRVQYEYDIYGNVIVEKGSSVWRGEVSDSSTSYKRQYDEKGKMVLLQAFDENGNLEWEDVSTFDSDGNEILCQRKDKNGNLEWEEFFSYDDNGNMIFNQRKDENGIILSEIIYDEKGNEISYQENYKNGKINWKSTYNYNNNGDLIVEETYHADSESSGKCEYEYTYDSNNKITSEICKYNGELWYTTKYEYKGDELVHAHKEYPEGVDDDLEYENGNLVRWEERNSEGETINLEKNVYKKFKVKKDK